MGAFFAHGYGPDALDRYSWAQVFLMVECLAERDAQRVDMLLSPIAGALGAEKYSPGRVSIPGQKGKHQTPSRGRYSDMRPEAVQARAQKRDARIVAAARKYGIRVVDVPIGS